MVKKLWGYFVGAPLDAKSQAGLVALYANGYQVKPVMRAILRHPALYIGPRPIINGEAPAQAPATLCSVREIHQSFSMDVWRPVATCSKCSRSRCQVTST